MSSVLVPLASRPRDTTGGEEWRLVACPPSGSGAAYFRPLAACVESAGGRLYGVRHPGRESRLREPLLTSVDALVDDALPAVLDLMADGLPTVLLGHSLGVGVAAHLTARLAVADAPLPAALVLSAREAPDSPRREDDARLRRVLGDDEALTRWLSDLGGLPVELLAQPELVDMILPIVRADLRASLDDDALPHLPAAGPPPVPLLLVCGSEDPITCSSDMTGWAALTSGPVQRLDVPGDHHAVLTAGADILDRVVALLGRR